MYPFLHELLGDHGGGVIFQCFGPWHMMYLAFSALALGLSVFRMAKVDGEGRERWLDGAIGVAFGLYIADFFLMPFAYEMIDMEKLPFHVCTATCVACFLSRRWEPLKPWRGSLAMLGFVSNLVYLIYPAGVMWHRVHPMSYRVIQTLSFHAVMAGYGFLTLCFGEQEAACKNRRKDLAVIVAQTLWAILGNALYNGRAGGYDHFFNWFFVVRDPFGILPETIAPLVMPFLNIGVFFAVEQLLRCLIQRFRPLADTEY